MASLFSAILPDHLKEKLGMRTSKERDKSGMFLLKLPIQGSKLWIWQIAIGGNGL